ncbi:MAG TPA: ATP-binding protein [Jiangellales bacterium]|nr:ATP-binding protein [Jiangellales bacterium]
MDQRDVAEFGRTFHRFLDEVVRVADTTPAGARSLADIVQDFVDADPTGLPVVSERFAHFEHPTVQVALDVLVDRSGTGSQLLGVAGMGREHHSLSELLVASQRHRAFWAGAVDYVAVPVGVDDEVACVRFGLYLVLDGERRLAVLLRGASPEMGRPPSLEVLAATAEDAHHWLSRLRDERAARNVLRGQVLSFEPSDVEPGIGPVRFHPRPDVARDDVVLPGGVLERVERQVLGVARHRGRLVAEGRHLKRGVLLYGPPGTGKTHTVRYLVGLLRAVTVVVLTGPSIRFVGEACALARTLQPALVVLEDCDLVAEDRSYAPFANPLLFTVLDEMDGLAPDSDVTFLLTTNRVDLLETALAQRPGRVDLAVELPLPDAEGRARLLSLYMDDVELTPADVERVVARSAGVPASFVKELARRATLFSAERGASSTEAVDVHAALEELMEAQEALTRRLLGSRDDEAPGRGDPGPGGWFAYVPKPESVAGGGPSGL